MLITDTFQALENAGTLPCPAFQHIQEPFPNAPVVYITQPNATMLPATALLLSGVTFSIFLYSCKAGTCIYYATLSLLGTVRDNLSHVYALVLMRFNMCLPLWLCLVVQYH